MYRMNDGASCACRLRNESRNSDNFLVQELTCDTIGRNGGGVFEIFFIFCIA